MNGRVRSCHARTVEESLAQNEPYPLGATSRGWQYRLLSPYSIVVPDGARGGGQPSLDSVGHWFSVRTKWVLGPGRYLVWRGIPSSGSAGLLLLLQLVLPLAAVSRLQRRHAGLTNVGVLVEENGQGIGLDNGGQLDAFLALVLGLAVGGSDDERKGPGRVDVGEDGVAGGFGNVLAVRNWRAVSRAVSRSPAGLPTSLLGQPDGAMVFALAAVEELGELCEELRGAQISGGSRAVVRRAGA